MSKTVMDITDLIITIYPRLRKIFRNLVAIKDVPITVTQLTGLAIVAKRGRTTMSDLAEELCMSNQQLTKVVDALCEFEMVERVVDSGNRRKIYAQVTPKGAQTIADFCSEVGATVKEIVGETSEEEVDKLYRSIAHLARYLGCD